MPFCNRCGGHIVFEKIAGRWAVVNKETRRRHNCKEAIQQQKSKLSLINYNNKKLGKNYATRN